MFIAVVRFPDIPTDREAEFRDWFEWSNHELADAEGLRSRRLLRSATGQYAALVEHDSSATFAAMHSKPVVAQIQARLHQIVPEPPHAAQFDVVAQTTAMASTKPETGSATGGCCADGGGHHDRDPQPAIDGGALAVEHSCCHAG